MISENKTVNYTENKATPYLQCRLSVHILIVWTVHFHFHDVLLYNGRIITHRLDKEELVAHLVHYHLVNHFPPING